jgi:hypothetical protein
VGCLCEASDLGMLHPDICKQSNGSRVMNCIICQKPNDVLKGLAFLTGRLWIYFLFLKLAILLFFAVLR